MTDPWWPEGTDDPAFQVKRQSYGLLTGGDYVRGSTVETLPQTALRYPTTTPGFDAATNKAFLTLRAFDYETAEVGWGWPINIEEKWSEVALVRSGFGFPTTVNDGQTVFRAGKPDFSTPATPAVLNPSVSAVTTTDNNFHIDTNYRITGRASIVRVSHVQYLASLWMPTPGGRSWVVYLDVDGSLKLQWSLNGNDDGWIPPQRLATTEALAALPKGPDDLIYLGVDFIKDNTPTYVVALTSTDGVTWTELESRRVLPAQVADTFNTTGVSLSVGARSDGGGSTHWEGKIAWVEARLLPETVRWRFNAADYPSGDVLTWTDPRTIQWTITDAAAMSRVVSSTISVPPPIVYDRPLQSGQWYYYSLFFKTTQLDWVLGMKGSVLIPRNYRHAEHLWNALPPFYRYTDSNQREGNGPLRQFLSVFGFEMDLTREFVEQWQEVYHIDKTPVPLLHRVGENFGVSYKGGVGDVRYRGLIAALPDLLRMRGTTVALKQVVESYSKWQCDITVGTNTMLLPDDSDFFTGTGNWGHLAADTDTLDTNISTCPALLIHGPPGTSSPPANTGRGTMRAVTKKTDETKNLVLACGDSVIMTKDAENNWVEVKTVVPLYAGVPVQPDSSYGFTCHVLQQAPAITTPYLLWFGQGGQPVNLIGKAAGNSFEPSDSLWHEFVVQGIAPAGAVYMVPVLYFTNRKTFGAGPNSAFIDVAGSTTYLLDDSGHAVAVIPPDSYLTLGDPAELLGVPDEARDFPGYIMGTPPEATP